MSLKFELFVDGVRVYQIWQAPLFLTNICIFVADIAKETGLWVQDVADTLEYLNMIESIPTVRRFKRRLDTHIVMY